MTWRLRKYSDLVCVEGVHSGNEEVQKRLYLQCRDRFDRQAANFGHLSEAERKDLFQDAFVLLWEKIENGQVFVNDGKVFATRRGGQATEVPDLGGYFLRIAKNLYHEVLRSKGKILLIAGELDDDSVLWWADDSDTMRKMIIKQSVMLLPPRCREILTMFYYHDMTLEQIQEERPESKTYNGVKSAKSKCMAVLRARILDKFAEAGIKIHEYANR
mgnify:FL=1